MTSFPEHYPEEYIHGSVQFFGREYQVNPSVLIPRLETECLIKRARTIIQEQSIQTVVDIGCGSGIIGTSLGYLVDNIVFLDISEGALDITKRNFQKYFPQKKSEFIISDLLGNLKKSTLITSSETILFATNLPYIRDEDWKNMSQDTQYEPRGALFGGGETGFELYERLFEEFSRLENLFYGVFEFGFDQRQIAEEILKKYPWKYSFFADYTGIERFGEITT